jgi:hypothetical protein
MTDVVLVIIVKRPLALEDPIQAFGVNNTAGPKPAAKCLETLLKACERY